MTRAGFPVLVVDPRPADADVASVFVDESDGDGLGELHPTEGEPRFHAIYRRMLEIQFGLEDLRNFTEADLVYIAGHREYDYPEAESVSVSEARGIQQKIRGNALRAKDELDRRHFERQLDALNVSNASVIESNEHMRDTARWTRTVALATAGVGVIAAITLLVTVVIALRN